MTHEKVAAEHLGLKIDTMNLRAIIREKTAQNRDMSAVVDNYRVIVIPAMEEKIRLYQEMNKSMDKKAKNNLLLGGGGGTLIGIILTLLLL